MGSTPSKSSVIRAPQLTSVARYLGVARESAEDGAMGALPSPIAQPVQPTAAQIEERIRNLSAEAARAAEKQGFEIGHAAGLAAARKEYSEKLERFGLLLESIAQRRDDLLEVLEDDLVELTFVAAANVISAESMRRELIVQTVRRALAEYSADHTLTVRICPQDLELIESSEQLAVLGAATRIKVQPDLDVRLGGCLIDAGRGSLDGRLEVFLARLVAGLVEGRNREERSAGRGITGAVQESP